MVYRGELQTIVLSVLEDHKKRNRKESRELFLGLKKEEEGSLARLEQIMKDAGHQLPRREISSLKNVILNTFFTEFWIEEGEHSFTMHNIPYNNELVDVHWLDRLDWKKNEFDYYRQYSFNQGWTGGSYSSWIVPSTKLYISLIGQLCSHKEGEQKKLIQKVKEYFHFYWGHKLVATSTGLFCGQQEPPAFQKGVHFYQHPKWEAEFSVTDISLWSQRAGLAVERIEQLGGIDTARWHMVNLAEIPTIQNNELEGMAKAKWHVGAQPLLGCSFEEAERLFSWISGHQVYWSIESGQYHPNSLYQVFIGLLGNEKQFEIKTYSCENILSATACPILISRNHESHFL